MDINLIIKYEQGDASDAETLELFASGIKSGKVWQLQGHYGRTAHALIEEGYISPEGEVLYKTE